MIARVDAAPTEVAAQAGRYDIHGVDIVVRTDVPAAGDAVATAYGAFTRSGPVGHDTAALVVLREGTGFRLVDHRGLAAIVPTETDAILGLLDRVVEAVLDGLAGRGFLGTHAGVVEIGGRAFLLAGQSGRGKSTLSLGLVRRGAGFLTDELALITSTDTVLPYPRALHVRPSTVDLLPELEFLRGRPRQDLGAGSEWSVTIHDLVRAFEARTPGPTPLGGIVLIATEPDPTRTPVIEPVPPAVAALELVRGTPMAAGDFTGTLGRLGSIVERVAVARLVTGELDRTAAAILGWAEARS